MSLLCSTIAVSVNTQLTGIYLVTISLITFCVYGYDKRQAIRQKRRIPEKWLHLLALAGGTIGAFAGQQLFRHKTKKWKFRLIFITIAMVQGAIIVWWLMNRGTSTVVG